MIKKFRLWWFKSLIGTWQTLDPQWYDGVLYAWRLNPDGTYDWRTLTEDEETEYVSAVAW